MPSDLGDLIWVGDYGEVWSFNAISYRTAYEQLLKKLKWMQNAKTQIKVAWEEGHTWGVGTHLYLSVPYVDSARRKLCVIESITKTHYGTSPNVSCNLIILHSDNDPDDTPYTVIDESGNRDTLFSLY